MIEVRRGRTASRAAGVEDARRAGGQAGLARERVAGGAMQCSAVQRSAVSEWAELKCKDGGGAGRGRRPGLVLSCPVLGLVNVVSLSFSNPSGIPGVRLLLLVGAYSCAA